MFPRSSVMTVIFMDALPFNGCLQSVIVDQVLSGMSLNLTNWITNGTATVLSFLILNS